MLEGHTNLQYARGQKHSRNLYGQWHPVASTGIQDTETTEMEAVARCWWCFCISAASSGRGSAATGWVDPGQVGHGLILWSQTSKPNLLWVYWTWSSENGSTMLNIMEPFRTGRSTTLTLQHHSETAVRLVQHHNSSQRTVTRNLEATQTIGTVTTLAHTDDKPTYQRLKHISSPFCGVCAVNWGCCDSNS